MPQVHLRHGLPGGRKVKWMTGEKACGGGQALKWETELASPNNDDFDLKWKWEAKSKPSAVGKAKTKWALRKPTRMTRRSR